MKSFLSVGSMALLVCGMFFAEPVAARLNLYILANKAKSFNDSCLEIGRTVVYPSVCKKPTKVLYKGVYCYGCPEASRCKPGCKGGKVCINQQCVCPPNRLLVDCNGKCQSPTVPCKLP